MQAVGFDEQGQGQELPVTTSQTLALISIDKSGVHKDQLIDGLLANVSPTIRSSICRYDLDSFEGKLSEIIANHTAVIILYSSEDGATGSISIYNLSERAAYGSSFHLTPTDADSLSDELKLASLRGQMPEQLILVVVELSQQNSAIQNQSDIKKRTIKNLAQLTSTFAFANSSPKKKKTNSRSIAH